MLGEPATEWEDLRREARKIENSIDSKLVVYARQASVFSTSSSGLDANKDDVPLSEKEQQANRLLGELEALLEKVRVCLDF
jgi:hypothetical protein